MFLRGLLIFVVTSFVLSFPSEGRINKLTKQQNTLFETYIKPFVVNFYNSPTLDRDIIEREYLSIHLNRVDKTSDVDYFYTVSSYHIVSKDYGSGILSNCERMEWVLFLVPSGKDTWNSTDDRYFGMQDIVIKCVYAQGESI